MKAVIHAGTHLGIVGCYGEKILEFKSFSELIKIIRKELSIPRYSPCLAYHLRGDMIFYFPDKKGKTIIEFRIFQFIEKKD